MQNCYRVRQLRELVYIHSPASVREYSKWVMVNGQIYQVLHFRRRLGGPAVTFSHLQVHRGRVERITRLKVTRGCSPCMYAFQFTSFLGVVRVFNRQRYVFNTTAQHIYVYIYPFIYCRLLFYFIPHYSRWMKRKISSQLYFKNNITFI